MTLDPENYTEEELEAFKQSIQRAGAYISVAIIEKLQARVKELEHDIERHINITSAQANEIITLERKLEVAREALEFYADCWDDGSKAIAQEALTATETASGGKDE